MDKLIEREAATRNPLVAAPALAVQFFLIPLAVVAITVSVYVGFRSLLADDRKPQDYLAEVRNGGSDRRWPAAYELSRLMADPNVRADLTLAIGRLDPPLPADAVAELKKTLDSNDGEARISAIWALGSSGDASVVPTLQPLYESSDQGIRKMVVYALGALPGEAQLPTLRTALQDSTADVRWNAAVALARKGNHDGVPVLRQMLDRPYVEQIVKRDVRQDEDRDPIADVMISGLRAAATLRDEALKAAVTTLSQTDRSMKVRQAALEALKVM